MTNEQIVEKLADLPLIVRGSQDDVFKTLRELQEAARQVDTSLLDNDSQAADDVAKERDEWKLFAGECMEGISASHRVLDELGVPREDAWLHETDGESYGIEEVTEYPVHERIKMLPPFVATRMRDKCVAKVKAIHEERLRDLRSLTDKGELEHDDAEYERAVLFVLSNVVNSIQSLTLDQEQEKQ